MRYRAVLKGVEAADLPRVRQTFEPSRESAVEWGKRELKAFPVELYSSARVEVFEVLEELVETVLRTA